MRRRPDWDQGQIPGPAVCHPLQDDLAALGFAHLGRTLTYQEIAAWASLMGRTLTPWQAVMLMYLSRDFVSGTQATTPPFDPIQTGRALLHQKLT